MITKFEYYLSVQKITNRIKNTIFTTVSDNVNGIKYFISITKNKKLNKIICNNIVN